MGIELVLRPALELIHRDGARQQECPVTHAGLCDSPCDGCAWEGLLSSASAEAAAEAQALGFALCDFVRLIRPEALPTESRASRRCRLTRLAGIPPDGGEPFIALCLHTGASPITIVHSLIQAPFRIHVLAGELTAQRIGHATVRTSHDIDFGPGAPVTVTFAPGAQTVYFEFPLTVWLRSREEVVCEGG